MVVILSSGCVFRTTAQRVLRSPDTLLFSCATARRNSSTQHATLLPDPTGPRSPRTKASDAKKEAATSPSTEYSKCAIVGPAMADGNPLDAGGLKVVVALRR